jgi:hypothetical protein
MTRRVVRRVLPRPRGRAPAAAVAQRELIMGSDVTWPSKSVQACVAKSYSLQRLTVFQ